MKSLAHFSRVLSAGALATLLLLAALNSQVALGAAKPTAATTATASAVGMVALPTTDCGTLDRGLTIGNIIIGNIIIGRDAEGHASAATYRTTDFSSFD